MGGAPATPHQLARFVKIREWGGRKEDSRWRFGGGFGVQARE